MPQKGNPNIPPHLWGNFSEVVECQLILFYIFLSQRHLLQKHAAVWFTGHCWFYRWWPVLPAESPSTITSRGECYRLCRSHLNTFSLCLSLMNKIPRIATVYNMLMCEPLSLYQLATTKGLIAGDLQYMEEDGTRIDCHCSSAVSLLNSRQLLADYQWYCNCNIIKNYLLTYLVVYLVCTT